MSRAKPLNEYRKSTPTETKKCEHCTTLFETKFGKYCSNACKTAAYRVREKTKASVLPCHFCGVAIEKKSHYKFCCVTHKNKFHKYKRSGKKVSLKINDRLTIETSKYDKIPDIINKYSEHAKRIN